MNKEALKIIGVVVAANVLIAGLAVLAIPVISVIVEHMYYATI